MRGPRELVDEARANAEAAARVQRDGLPATVTVTVERSDGDRTVVVSGDVTVRDDEALEEVARAALARARRTAIRRLWSRFEAAQAKRDAAPEPRGWPDPAA